MHPHGSVAHRGGHAGYLVAKCTSIGAVGLSTQVSVGVVMAVECIHRCQGTTSR